jgi:hypothetical protein
MKTKNMILKFPSIQGAALAFLLLTSGVQAGPGGRSPELPSPDCSDLQPESGSRVRFRAFAIGVQIYRWDGSAWIFQGPEAGLYADPGFQGQIGIHYGGPTWEGNDGSVVRGTVAARCFLSADDIPWLLLAATPGSEPGLFSRITAIQRVNTSGGTVPNYTGGAIGEEARIPYTAEYFFYTVTE